MQGLIQLYFVFGNILGFTVHIVLSQDEAPLIRECGKDGSTTEIHLGHQNAPVLIRNYNFAHGLYRNSEDCQIQFWAENQPLLLNVTFNVFELEAEAKCRLDYLCINGVNFCGSWEVNITFSYKVPARRSFTMRFVTDASVTKRGFEIRVDARKTDDHTNFPEVSHGYGSADELLVRNTPSKEAYRDKCLPGNHLHTETSFTPNKSITTTTDGPDTTRIDYQSENNMTTTNPLLTDFHRSDASRKPVQIENTVYDTASDPHQLNNSSYDDMLNSFQTNDSSPTPYQTQTDASNNITDNPFQKDNLSYDTGSTTLQYDHLDDDTSTRSRQIYNSDYDTNNNQLLKDNTRDQPTSNPIHADTGTYNTSLDPLQTHASSYVSTSNPLEAITSSYEPTLNPFETITSSYDSTSNPLETITSSYDTTSNQLETITSFYNSISNPLETITSSNDSTSNSLETITSSFDTASVTFHTDNPNYAKSKTNYTLSDTLHDLRHIDHSANDTPSNPLETTHLSHLITHRTNETHPSMDSNIDSQQTDPSINISMDSAPGNEHPQLYDMTGDELGMARASETPVISCSSYIEPIPVNSPNATYFVQNVGFGTKPYYNDQQCSVEFRTPSSARLFTVKFLFLDLERNPWCSYDSLCVGGVKFCDSSETGHAYKYVVPAGRTFTLAFTSDVSNTGNGFEVEVDIQEEIMSHHTDSMDNYVDSCSFNPIVPPVTSKLDIIEGENEATYPSSPGRENGFRTTGIVQTTDYNLQDHLTTDRGYQTTDSEYQTTDREYQTRDRGYQTTDKGFETTDKRYQTTDQGYQTTYTGYDTTDRVVQTTEKSYETTDRGYHTTDTGYETTDYVYQTTDVSYQTIVTGYGTTDKGVHTTQKGYETTDSGYQTTGKNYQTTNKGDQTTDNRDQTTGSIYKIRDPLDQTTDSDDQELDNSDEVTDPEIPTTDDVSGSKSNYSAPTSNPWVEGSTIYCGDQASTVNVVHEKSRYIVKSGQHEHRTGYANNERCLVVYGTPDVPKLFAVTFRTFDIEYHQSCCYDFLCIKGVKFCGDWAEGYTFKYVVPAFSTFTLVFSTDETKSGRGFEIEISITEPPADTTVTEVFSGVGSKEAWLKYQFSNISDYTDKCQNPIACANGHCSSSSTLKTTQKAPTNWQDPSADPAFLAQHLHVILRMIEAAQDRISYAYDLLTSLIR